MSSTEGQASGSHETWAASSDGCSEIDVISLTPPADCPLCAELSKNAQLAHEALTALASKVASMESKLREKEQISRINEEQARYIDESRRRIVVLEADLAEQTVGHNSAKRELKQLNDEYKRLTERMRKNELIIQNAKRFEDGYNDMTAKLEEASLKKKTLTKKYEEVVLRCEQQAIRINAFSSEVDSLKEFKIQAKKLPVAIRLINDLVALAEENHLMTPTLRRRCAQFVRFEPHHSLDNDDSSSDDEARNLEALLRSDGLEQKTSGRPRLARASKANVTVDAGETAREDGNLEALQKSDGVQRKGSSSRPRATHNSKPNNDVDAVENAHARLKQKLPVADVQPSTSNADSEALVSHRTIHGIKTKSVREQQQEMIEKRRRQKAEEGSIPRSPQKSLSPLKMPRTDSYAALGIELSPSPRSSPEKMIVGRDLPVVISATEVSEKISASQQRISDLSLEGNGSDERGNDDLVKRKDVYGGARNMCEIVSRSKSEPLAAVNLPVLHRRSASVAPETMFCERHYFRKRSMSSTESALEGVTETNEAANFLEGKCAPTARRGRSRGRKGSRPVTKVDRKLSEKGEMLSSEKTPLTLRSRPVEQSGSRDRKDSENSCREKAVAESPKTKKPNDIFEGEQEMDIKQPEIDSAKHLTPSEEERGPLEKLAVMEEAQTMLLRNVRNLPALPSVSPLKRVCSGTLLDSPCEVSVVKDKSEEGSEQLKPASSVGQSSEVTTETEEKGSRTLQKGAPKSARRRKFSEVDEGRGSKEKGATSQCVESPSTSPSKATGSTRQRGKAGGAANNKDSQNEIQLLPGVASLEKSCSEVVTELPSNLLPQQSSSSIAEVGDTAHKNESDDEEVAEQKEELDVVYQGHYDDAVVPRSSCSRFEKKGIQMFVNGLELSDESDDGESVNNSLCIDIKTVEKENTKHSQWEASDEASLTIVDAPSEDAEKTPSTKATSGDHQEGAVEAVDSLVATSYDSDDSSLESLQINIDESFLSALSTEDEADLIICDAPANTEETPDSVCASNADQGDAVKHKVAEVSKAALSDNDDDDSGSLQIVMEESGQCSEMTLQTFTEGLDGTSTNTEVNTTARSSAESTDDLSGTEKRTRKKKITRSKPKNGQQEAGKASSLKNEIVKELPARRARKALQKKVDERNAPIERGRVSDSVREWDKKRVAILQEQLVLSESSDDEEDKKTEKLRANAIKGGVRPVISERNEESGVPGSGIVQSRVQACKSFVSSDSSRDDRKCTSNKIHRENGKEGSAGLVICSEGQLKSPDNKNAETEKDGTEESDVVGAVGEKSPTEGEGEETAAVTAEENGEENSFNEYESSSVKRQSRVRGDITQRKQPTGLKLGSLEAGKSTRNAPRQITLNTLRKLHKNLPARKRSITQRKGEEVTTSTKSRTPVPRKIEGSFVSGASAKKVVPLSSSSTSNKSEDQKRAPRSPPRKRTKVLHSVEKPEVIASSRSVINYQTAVMTLIDDVLLRQVPLEDIMEKFRQFTSVSCDELTDYLVKYVNDMEVGNIWHSVVTKARYGDVRIILPKKEENLMEILNQLSAEDGWGDIIHQFFIKLCMSFRRYSTLNTAKHGRDARCIFVAAQMLYNENPESLDHVEKLEDTLRFCIETHPSEYVVPVLCYAIGIAPKLVSRLFFGDGDSEEDDFYRELISVHLAKKEYRDTFSKIASLAEELKREARAGALSLKAVDADIFMEMFNRLVNRVLFFPSGIEISSHKITVDFENAIKKCVAMYRISSNLVFVNRVDYVKNLYSEAVQKMVSLRLVPNKDMTNIYADQSVLKCDLSDVSKNANCLILSAHLLIAQLSNMSSAASRELFSLSGLWFQEIFSIRESLEEDLQKERLSEADRICLLALEYWLTTVKVLTFRFGS